MGFLIIGIIIRQVTRILLQAAIVSVITTVYNYKKDFVTRKESTCHSA